MSAITIKNPDGSTFTGCECIAAVWPLLNELARKRGIVKSNLDVMQGSYSQRVKQSAKTHYYGGVLDLRLYPGKEQALDDLLEEMGFASFQRGPVSYDSFSPHFHVIMIACPHLHWQAANQVVSWKNRRDGLVRNWRDRDTTRPSVYRTPAQAVQWAKAQLGRAGVTASAAVAVAKKKPVAAPPISFSATMSGYKTGKPTGNVKHVQALLKKRGLYPGPIDGVYGPQTKMAVKKFQRYLFKTTDPKVADGVLGWKSFKTLVETNKTWTAVR